jgi:leucyl/phenylalanyl-tRNA--protein transferase
MVLFPRDLHVSKSLRRTIRSGRFSVTVDRAFDAVMEGCAAPRPQQDGTWITADMVNAYTRLAQLGFAHSVETWEGSELVGGLYGVALGRVFYGEWHWHIWLDSSIAGGSLSSIAKWRQGTSLLWARGRFRATISSGMYAPPLRSRPSGDLGVSTAI